MYNISVKEKVKVRAIAICGNIWPGRHHTKLYTIGIVTDKMKYIEHEMTFRKTDLTMCV